MVFTPQKSTILINLPLHILIIMGIELHVEPRKVYSWEEFTQFKPPFSIALDGFVDGPTQRDTKGPYANFDHHSQVDRMVTRSTSAQVHMEINMDLFDTFKKEGIPHANVFINDPDEDTCLAYWLLKNHDLVTHHAQPRINRLVYCEDMLDCTAGAYPFGETGFRRQMAWIFEPYNNARFKGQIQKMEDTEMRSIIESVSGRISEHIFDKGGEIALEGHYKKIGGGQGWTMTQETGPASRMAMYNDGIKAFVTLVSEKDGSFVYVLGRKSPWTKFDIPKFYAMLNEQEKEIVDENNRWGGSDIIGGSPRSTGSKIPPDELQEIINSEI